MDLTTLTIAVLLLVGVAAGAAASAAVTARVMRAQGALEVERVRAQMAERTAAAEARAERLGQENDQLLDLSRKDSDVMRALGPLHETLARMDRQVHTLERDRTSQFSALTTQLQEAQRTDSALLTATQGLSHALRSTTARGSWGEMELRRVLELSGLTPQISFLEQRSYSSAAARTSEARTARPDVVVHLPGQRVVLIDAKAPMDAYLRAAAAAHSPAADPAESAEETPGSVTAARERSMAGHAKAVRSHIIALASRDYQSQVAGSVDIVVLFLPTESLLSEALRADPGIVEFAIRNGVALATPTSLLALLRSVAAVWSQEKLADEAQEILDLGKELTSRLSIVAGHVDKLGGSLRASVQHYNRTVASLEDRLMVTARRFESLNPDEEALTPPTPLVSERAQLRAFTTLDVGGDQQRQSG